jgi:rod shape-determining protein MreD
VTAQNWARLALVLVAAVVVQAGLLDQVVVLGAHPDGMVVLAAAGGLLGGPRRGAVVGFLAGVGADLLVNLPFGLSALADVLVGFAVGMVRTSPLQGASRGLAAAVCAAAGAAGTLAYAVVGALLGQRGMLGPDLAAALVVVTVGGALLSLPALALVRWSFAGVSARRVPFGVPSGGSAAG